MALTPRSVAGRIKAAGTLYAAPNSGGKTSPLLPISVPPSPACVSLHVEFVDATREMRSSSKMAAIGALVALGVIVSSGPTVRAGNAASESSAAAVSATTQLQYAIGSRVEHVTIEREWRTSRVSAAVAAWRSLQVAVTPVPGRADSTSAATAGAAATALQPARADAASIASASRAVSTTQAGQAAASSGAAAGALGTIASPGRADATAGAQGAGIATTVLQGSAPSQSAAVAAVPSAATPAYIDLRVQHVDATRVWRTSRPEIAVAAYFAQSDGLTLCVLPGPDTSVWPAELAFTAQQVGPKAAACIVAIGNVALRNADAPSLSSASAGALQTVVKAARADSAAGATAGLQASLVFGSRADSQSAAAGGVAFPGLIQGTGRADSQASASGAKASSALVPGFADSLAFAAGSRAGSALASGSADSQATAAGVASSTVLKSARADAAAGANALLRVTVSFAGIAPSVSYVTGVMFKPTGGPCDVVRIEHRCFTAKHPRIKSAAIEHRCFTVHWEC